MTPVPTRVFLTGCAILLRGARSTLRDALAFNHLLISINRRICELVNFAAGPANLDIVNLFRRAQTQYFSGIVRREVAAARSLQTASLHAARLPSDYRSNGRRVALSRYQLQTNPVVF